MADPANTNIRKDCSEFGDWFCVGMTESEICDDVEQACVYV